jgi:hypothetical protein
MKTMQKDPLKAFSSWGSCVLDWFFSIARWNESVFHRVLWTFPVPIHILEYGYYKIDQKKVIWVIGEFVHIPTRPTYDDGRQWKTATYFVCDSSFPFSSLSRLKFHLAWRRLIFFVTKGQFPLSPYAYRWRRKRFAYANSDFAYITRCL